VVGFGCPECSARVNRFVQDSKGGWQPAASEVLPPPIVRTTPEDEVQSQAQRRALAAGRAEIRQVQRRQVFIEGKPVGGSF
jgi:hypothetical protein